MLKIAILDDDQKDREKIVEVLKGEGLSPSLYSNEKELYSALECGMYYDVLFLDILGVNGIDVAIYARKKLQDASIIFITSSEDFAIEAYKI